MINVKPYVAMIRSTLRLTLRDRVVLFFSYMFPLVFFLAFGEGMHAAQGPGAAAQVVSMVLVLGVLGNGFFGGGMRATMERENGILRRFKVAPISPAPLLVASMFTGWVIFMPAALLFVLVAHFRYGMPIPPNSLSLFVVVTLGAVSFRAIGLIIASVVNSMAESQIITQLLYFPMLLLSGATFPLSFLPEWLQVVAQFLPATHFYLAMQGVMLHGESVWDNRFGMLALAVATIIALFISIKLFRWEKEEKLKPAAKMWVVAALAPFLLIGGWQAYSKTNLQKTRILARQTQRGMTWLIRDARIITGDGNVIASGSVVIRDGRIQQVVEGHGPDPKEIKAEVMDAAGRTLMPGLIDSGVVLPATSQTDLKRELKRELYSGVTGVVALGGNAQLFDVESAKIMMGDELGALVLKTLAAGAADPPSLAAVEWAEQVAAQGVPLLLDHSLAQQVLPPTALASLKRELAAKPQMTQQTLPAAIAELKKLGTLPLPASSGGRWKLPAAPAFHRELQLLVQAGYPAADVLKAATYAAALNTGNRDLGVIRPGARATLILIDGNPLEEIAATERINAVFFLGERVDRGALLEDSDSK